MASDIRDAADILIAAAAAVLREMATTARRDTTEWQDEAAMPNQKITIPIASPKAVTDITQPRTPFASAQDFAPRAVEVVLDKWKGVNFWLSDREQMELKPGIFPREAEEALRGIVNAVDIDILNTALRTPYAVMANYPASTPPANKIQWENLTLLHQMLFDNKCPFTPGDISCFIDGTMQAQLLQLAEFMRYDATGETGALRTASLGTRLNIDFFANQHVRTVTVGAAPGTYTVDGANSEGWNGSTAVLPTGKTNQRIETNGTTTAPQIGDLVTIAGGGTRPYTVVGGSAEGVTPVVGGSITIRPSLRPGSSVANAAAITHAAPAVPTATGEPDAGDSYVLGYAFHRSAIAFASRPLSSLESPGTIIRSTADPLSGIAVRLEVLRVGKTTEWQWDILYGTQLVREEMTSRWLYQAVA